MHDTKWYESKLKLRETRFHAGRSTLASLLHLLKPTSVPCVAIAERSTLVALAIRSVVYSAVWGR
jgi:hypothetical protein